MIRLLHDDLEGMGLKHGINLSTRRGKIVYDYPSPSLAMVRASCTELPFFKLNLDIEGVWFLIKIEFWRI